MSWKLEACWERTALFTIVILCLVINFHPKLQASSFKLRASTFKPINPFSTSQQPSFLHLPPPENRTPAPQLYLYTWRSK